MFDNHYYTLNKVCRCKIGDDSVEQAADIFKMMPVGEFGLIVWGPDKEFYGKCRMIWMVMVYE